MGRFGWLILVALAMAGCTPSPAPDPQAEEPPGFSPCTPNERATALEYSLCPVDAAFPYGVSLAGSFDSIGGGRVRFDADDGGSWELAFTADPTLVALGVDWVDSAADGSDTMELTVNAPCTDPDEHWFEVTGDGRLLVAGGTAIYAEPQDALWAVGRSPRQDILTSHCVSELRACECWESCYAIPIGYKYDGGFVAELYSAERTRRGSYQVMAFEAWRGVGAPTCADAVPEEGRWLVLHEG